MDLVDITTSCVFYVSTLFNPYYPTFVRVIRRLSHSDVCPTPTFVTPTFVLSDVCPIRRLSYPTFVNPTLVLEPSNMLRIRKKTRDKV